MSRGAEEEEEDWIPTWVNRSDEIHDSSLAAILHPPPPPPPVQVDYYTHLSQPRPTRLLAGQIEFYYRGCLNVLIGCHGDDILDNRRFNLLCQRHFAERITTFRKKFSSATEYQTLQEVAANIREMDEVVDILRRARQESLGPERDRYRENTVLLWYKAGKHQPNPTGQTWMTIVVQDITPLLWKNDKTKTDLLRSRLRKAKRVATNVAVADYEAKRLESS